jgi:hypothetical protein
VGTEFRHARLKIQRADKHISDVAMVVASLPDTYSTEVETDFETGKETLKYGYVGTETVGEQIALISGDAIHNLRSSLDHAWIGTLQKHIPSAADNFSKFPVRKLRKEVEAILRGRKIDAACPSLYKLIVSDIKPYLGGNDNIHHLHELDISDKHLALIPFIHYTAIRDITFKNKETGEIIRGDTWADTRRPPHFVDLPEGNWHVEDKGQLSVEVLFGDTNPLKGFEILDSLQFLSKMCLNIVQLFENL